MSKTPDPPPSAGAANCPDCEEEEITNDCYECEKCAKEVTVCANCHVILTPCPCGHCPEGEVFYTTND